MRRILVIAIALAAVAWYQGWRPRMLDVPAYVTDRAGCDPSYPTVCLPSPPPQLDCERILTRHFKVFGADPHGLDPDGDGFAC